jgi:nicotinamide mononucleotide transporter
MGGRAGAWAGAEPHKFPAPSRAFPLCHAAIALRCSRSYGRGVWSPMETVAVLLGIANIILIIRRSVWNYPFGIAMVTLYFFIFRDLKLYSDAALQIFFLIINVYGWYSWHRKKANQGEIVVERLGTDGFAAWIAGSILATLGWGFVMSNHTDASYPFWDAGVAMLSVVAQILMTRRYLENWWWWIVVNIISIPLYILKGIYLTAGLYALFLALAIAGLLEWRKVRTKALQNTVSAEPVEARPADKRPSTGSGLG